MSEILWLAVIVAVWFVVRRLTPRPPKKLKSLDQLQEAAEQGDADAQYELGWIYGSDMDKDAKAVLEYNVEKDVVKSFEWYRKAALQGHAEAQLRLSLCYSLGKGVAEDGVLSSEWLQKSVEQGYAGAQLWLGLRYYYGEEGVEKDLDKAIEWITKAANQGDELAIAHLKRLKDGTL